MNVATVSCHTNLHSIVLALHPVAKGGNTCHIAASYRRQLVRKAKNCQ